MHVAFNDFTLDSATRELRRGGEPLRISPKGFELLVRLTEASPRALSKREILELVWPGTFISEATLAALIAELRALLDDDARKPRFIRTVYGFGYAFSAEVIAAGQTKSALVARLIWGGREISLSPGPNIIGRGNDSVAWVDDVSVSRHHARISISDTVSTIEDLGSKNGTFLGGKRIREEQSLADGDRVIFGRVPMIFRLFRDGTSTESMYSR